MKQLNAKLASVQTKFLYHELAGQGVPEGVSVVELDSMSQLEGIAEATSPGDSLGFYSINGKTFTMEFKNGQAEIVSLEAERAEAKHVHAEERGSLLADVTTETEMKVKVTPAAITAGSTTVDEAIAETIDNANFGNKTWNQLKGRPKNTADKILKQHVQLHLRKAGFDPGKIDGWLGKGSRGALDNYRKSFEPDLSRDQAIRRLYDTGGAAPVVRVEPEAAAVEEPTLDIQIPATPEGGTSDEFRWEGDEPQAPVKIPKAPSTEAVDKPTPTIAERFPLSKATELERRARTLKPRNSISASEGYQRIDLQAVTFTNEGDGQRPGHWIAGPESLVGQTIMLTDMLSGAVTEVVVLPGAAGVISPAAAKQLRLGVGQTANVGLYAATNGRGEKTPSVAAPEEGAERAKAFAKLKTALGHLYPPTVGKFTPFNNGPTIRHNDFYARDVIEFGKKAQTDVPQIVAFGERIEQALSAGDIDQTQARELRAQRSQYLRNFLGTATRVDNNHATVLGFTVSLSKEISVRYFDDFKKALPHIYRAIDQAQEALDA